MAKGGTSTRGAPVAAAPSVVEAFSTQVPSQLDESGACAALRGLTAHTFDDGSGPARTTRVAILLSGTDLLVVQGGVVVGCVDESAALDETVACIRLGYSFVGEITSMPGDHGESFEVQAWGLRPGR